MKFVRDRKDRQAMREKFWEITGTKMGSVVNHDASISKQALDVTIHSESGPAIKVEKTDEVNYKADSQYAGALNKK